MTTEGFLTVPEVAERWRLSNRHVRDAIGRKHLRAIKIGGHWLIAPADLESYEASRLNVPRTPKRTRLPQKRGAA